ncbi:MAG TPA: ethanolamine ammonia-lyase light chain EutC, partial [Panacibacter sp.]|nr:ethanolamine ammonia-lyase light chain EutC [Panacibacter sp.]
GRVAIADEVGAMLNAKLSLVLIGERPGLSAQDSMSAYFTWHPKPGLTDESRNCISNIRPQGLGYKDAADKINYLIQQAFHLNLSGVLLKDDCNLRAHL